MKRLFLFVLMFTMVILAACTPVQGFAQKVVELPSPIQLAIFAGVTFVVGWAFTKVATVWPWLSKFLGQYVDEVSMALAGALVLEIQNLLNAIPPQWEGVASAGLMLIVAILAALGLIKTARQAQVPGFRS